MFIIMFEEKEESEWKQEMNVRYEEFPFLNETKHVISLVGAGGKTTLMYAFAERYVKTGVRVIVTTTTHIARPEEKLWAKNPGQVSKLWAQGMYAVVGNACEDGKLKGLSEEELNAYIQMADVVLVEADGAKRMPCKVPAAHEPVIPDHCDIVVGVMGMDAYGKPIEEVCFRKNETLRLLNAAPMDWLNEAMMAKILSSVSGTRKSVGERAYYVVLNKCDTKERICVAEKIRELLRKQGIENCIFTSFL